MPSVGAPIVDAMRAALRPDPAPARKGRGAFFTPPAAARFIARWAVRDAADLVLEPACGEAVFLLEAARVFGELRGGGELHGRLHGVEMHPPSAERSIARLAGAGIEAAVRAGDFFDEAAGPRFDAVIGNPPYVRYQSFRGEARAKARGIALAAGVPLTGLASSWAAFVVHAAQLLRPGGRLGLVLPAELLSVNYAASVRRFLMDRFARVHLVTFEELVFPGVSEEVLLLLAEGRGPTARIELSQARDLDDLDGLAALAWRPYDPDDKWTPALLSGEAFATYAEAAGGPGFGRLSDWGRVDLGAVTGNNGFFALSRAAVRERGIPAREVRHIAPPGSRHLRGQVFRQQDWERLADSGRQVLLFHPPDDHPSAAARRYIAEGERTGVADGYKCRHRRPWWRVPGLREPDLFVTYMNHGAPRLVRNDAGVACVNSVHGLSLAGAAAALGSELLPLAALNSLTRLGAELVGRAYGGGLLKVEPREAEALPVPAIDVVASAAAPLAALARRPPATPDELVAAVDDVLLRRELGLGEAELAQVRQAREALHGRRSRRGRGRRP